MLGDCDNVIPYLKATKCAIEDAMDNLERGKKARDVRRKEILLTEMKQVLAMLSETDNKVVKDLKGEAFDMIRSISKVIDEVNPQHNAQQKNQFVKDKVKSLGLDEFLRSLDVSVSVQPGFMTSAMEKISDAIILDSPVLNSKQMILELPEKLTSFQPVDYNPKYVDINIYSVSDSMTFTPLVLKQLVVEVTGLMPDKGRFVLEERSVWSMLEERKSKIGEDGGCITVQVRRPNNIFGRISVRVLGSNIVNSPILHQFYNENKEATAANDTIGVFDMTVNGLDESDLVSLDMTTRRQMLLSAGKQQLLSNPTFPASPAFQGHRRVSKQPNISSVPEAPSLDQHSQLGESNTLSAVTLPLVEGVPEDCQEEDPHLMLNASKAPSPQSMKCWQKEDSIWDDVPDYDQDDDDEDSDPHLMLNASKAPPAGADWPTVDPIWNRSSSLLHQSVNQDINQSVWGDDLLDQVDNIDFLTATLEVEEVFKSHEIAVSSSRGAMYCLESPCCVTYLPQRQSFLVTEPAHHRVGLYEGASFQFVCWLEYPQQVGNGRTCYNYPTSVLALDSGYVALVEKDNLHIFDGQVWHLQSIRGEFHGLAEGPSGEIFTLGKNKNQDIVIKKLVRETSQSKPGIRRRAHFKFLGQIKLDVIQTFPDWAVLSKARFLTYSQERIFMTDLGLHKLYTLNLRTGEQSVSGYMGSKLGQFKRPTGLVADDVGNLIVGDSENNRLVVVNKAGMVVKVVPQSEGLYCFPHDLVRVDNSLLAVYMAGKEGEKGVIVRYRVVPAGQNGQR